MSRMHVTPGCDAHGPEADVNSASCEADGVRSARHWAAKVRGRSIPGSIHCCRNFTISPSPSLSCSACSCAVSSKAATFSGSIVNSGSIFSGDLQGIAVTSVADGSSGKFIGSLGSALHAGLVDEA